MKTLPSLPEFPRFTRPTHDEHRLTPRQWDAVAALARAGHGVAIGEAQLVAAADRWALAGLRKRRLVHTVSLTPEPSYVLTEAGWAALRRNPDRPAEAPAGVTR